MKNVNLTNWSLNILSYFFIVHVNFTPTYNNEIEREPNSACDSDIIVFRKKKPVPRDLPKVWNMVIIYKILDEF